MILTTLTHLREHTTNEEAIVMITGTEAQLVCMTPWATRRQACRIPGYRAPPPPFPDTPGGYRAPSLQDTSYRTPGENNGYRPNYPKKYPDYKPVPPPKSAPYKPVPPPKPKSSSNNPPEGNYMNNGYASSNSMHYHSSNINNGKLLLYLTLNSTLQLLKFF